MTRFKFAGLVSTISAARPLAGLHPEAGTILSAMSAGLDLRRNARTWGAGDLTAMAGDVVLKLLDDELLL